MTVVKRVVVSTESEQHNGLKKAGYEASMNRNEEGINSSNATAHFFWKETESFSANWRLFMPKILLLLNVFVQIYLQKAILHIHKELSSFVTQIRSMDVIWPKFL